MSKERDNIRAGILATHDRASEIITIFGQKVELRQPTIAQIEAMQANKEEGSGLAHILVEYCYVPKTNEKIFTLADVATIMELPSGKWLSDLNEKVGKLLGIDIKAAEKNLGGTAIN